MRKYLLIASSIAFSFANGQSYDQLSKASELCMVIQENGFMSDKEADMALDNILSVIGASKRFIMQPCNNINNAVATSYKGLRYILYDRDFMNQIANGTNNWPQIFILAHEVGHHVNGHSVDIILQYRKIVEPKTLETRRLQELESDEFAGFVLAKLGANLGQAQLAANYFSSDSDDTYSTHPNKTKRLNAVRIGYYKALGKSSKVIEKPTEFKRSLASVNADEYYDSGRAKLGIDYQGAIADFDIALEIKPNAAWIYYERGVAKLNLKDYNGAISDLNKTLEINPKDKDGRSKLGQVYLEFGEQKAMIGDYEGAIMDCNKAMEIDSENPGNYLGYIGYYKNISKDYKGALIHYTKAIEIDPKNRSFYLIQEQT